MSHHLVNGAVAIDVHHTRKIVLLMLAHGAVMSTRRVVFRVDDMARKCGMSPSSVREVLVELRRLGHIELVHHYRGTWEFEVLPRGGE